MVYLVITFPENSLGLLLIKFFDNNNIRRRVCNISVFFMPNEVVAHTAAYRALQNFFEFNFLLFKTIAQMIVLNLSCWFE